jgi:Sap, sulfolipid-1-addressing protein
MNLQILPLAITMMAGLQIMSAIIFVTASKPVKLSASYLAGVAIAATVGVAIFLALGNNFSLGDPGDKGSTGNMIQYVLVGLLLLLAIKNYVRRETDDGGHEPRAEQRLFSRRAAVPRGDRSGSGASCAVLSPVPQACRAVHAEGQILDEYPQLAGEHPRLRRVHPAHPRLMSTCRKGGRP